MAEGTAPIVARIVIDGSGISGLGGAKKVAEDPENTVKKTNKLFRQLISIQKMIQAESAGSMIKKLIMSAGGYKLLTPAGAGATLTTAGVLAAGAAAGYTGSKAMDLIAEEDAVFAENREKYGYAVALMIKAYGYVEDSLLVLRDDYTEISKETDEQSALEKEKTGIIQKVKEKIFGVDKNYDEIDSETGKQAVLEKEKTEAIRQQIIRINRQHGGPGGGGAIPEELFKSRPGGIPEVGHIGQTDSPFGLWFPPALVGGYFPPDYQYSGAEVEQ